MSALEPGALTPMHPTMLQAIPLDNVFRKVIHRRQTQTSTLQLRFRELSYGSKMDEAILRKYLLHL